MRLIGTILNSRRLLEKHELTAGILSIINGYPDDHRRSLRQGTIVDATLIHVQSSTKNQDGKRAPEMHQAKKGYQRYFGMKAHIGVDDESGLLHGDENVICADASHSGVEKRPEHEDREVFWQIAARRSTTRSWVSAASCTKPSARSKQPRRR